MIDVRRRVPGFVGLPDQEDRRVNHGSLGEAGHAGRAGLAPQRHAPGLQGQHVSQPTSVQALEAVGCTCGVVHVGGAVGLQHGQRSGQKACGRHAEALADGQLEMDLKPPCGRAGDAPNGAEVVNQGDVHRLTFCPRGSKPVLDDHLDLAVA